MKPQIIFVPADEQILRIPRADDWFDLWAKQYAVEVWGKQEAQARRLILERLPNRLAWLIDRPRMLRLAFRLRPAWRPEVGWVLDVG